MSLPGYVSSELRFTALTEFAFGRTNSRVSIRPCLTRFLGFYGLAAAKAYLDLNPSANVVVLESAASIGGVWAQERLYPGLLQNNLFGTYEFSDFPMDEAAFDVQQGKPIPGEVIHRYIRAFAEEFGLYSLVRFNTRVGTIEKTDEDGWLITSVGPSKGSGASKSQILTRKLILATGLFSEPNMPVFQGADDFEAPVFHVKDLARQKEMVRNADRVAVVSASKSGYDAAYLAASSGVEVDWIIRSSGNGPSWMTPPYVTPLKKRLEKLANIRVLTWFNPCISGGADGYGLIRRLLHGTAIGRWLVDKFYGLIAWDVLRLNAYDKHPGTLKLKPWSDAFWASASFSILNYPTNFFDHVRNGNIRVHISDISHLSPSTVHLTNGDKIITDGLIVATGWKGPPSIRFLPEGIDRQLGLPHESTEPDKLAAEADEFILNRFPRLRRRPVVNTQYKDDINGVSNEESNVAATIHSFRLHRCMVPPAFLHDRSIGFAGMLSNFSTVTCAQTQALWLAAYLSGKLPLEPPSAESQARVEWEATLASQFGRWRHPFGSSTHPDFIFDFLPYVDWLLGDLGLRVHRKSGILAEWFEPYGPEDYRGLVDEWKEKHGIE